MLRAGFAEIEITPPIGTHIIGWLADVVSTSVRGPLFARVAVFETPEQQIAFVQLDTLSVRWQQVCAIRERVTREFGFPGVNVMVSATHNHAGPAVVNCGDVRRDDAYVAELEERVARAFGEALRRLAPAEIAFGRAAEFGLSYNRRVVMRSGIVKTQATFNDSEALYLEGPIDPEIATLIARRPTGELLGALVNFACHPTHQGSNGVLSAGFPGALAREMAASGCPVTLFLNGAAGNIIYFDARHGNAGLDQDEIGRRLAARVMSSLEGAVWKSAARIGSAASTISLPFREVTEAEIRGTMRGAQRFVDPAAYDREIPRVVARIRERGRQVAQVQAHFIDDVAYIAIPACGIRII